MRAFLNCILTIFLVGCGGSSTPRDKHLVTEVDLEVFETEQKCLLKTDEVNWQALMQAECEILSSYNLFLDNADPKAKNNENTPGIKYEINSELFTDYARKYRYLYIPPNTKITYSEKEALEFPVGSVLVKVFSMPKDTNLPEETILEVRLLIHRNHGWVGLVYVWDDNAKDGVLDLDSESIEFSLTHKGDVYSGIYRVPSFGSCANCHQYNSEMIPIGPKARLLNKPISYDGEAVNQLQLWKDKGILEGLPESLVSVEKAPSWKDETVSLELRAKSYLDINCAHCHREQGSASLSGLKLEYGRTTVD